MRTRIKICGITNVDDARAAAQAGADAIGMILGYQASPRNLSVAQAAGIAAGLPPFVTAVGLFVDAPVADVQHAMRHAQLQMLQFHGSDELETPAYCAQFGLPYLKAIRMAPKIDLVQCALRYCGARGLLLDAHVAGQAGGTGQRFDWDRIPRSLGLPVVLSGGLDPDNVADAIRRVRPAAVDVASGVERAKGLKDHARINAFVQAVRATDAELDQR
jgi:phosphoribosylanthranilate isomerase